jgi:hypothetical protein
MTTYQSTTVTDFGTDATTHNAVMPATVAAGDLLLALAAFDSLATTITTPNGWTLILSGPAIDPIFGIYAKVAVGNEDGASVDFVTSNAQRGSVHVLRFSGWEGTLDGGLRAAMGADGTTPITALAVGITAREIIWVSAQVKSSASAWGASPPSSYINENKSGVGLDTSGAGSIASATRARTVAVEDIPALWNAASDIMAMQVAVMPGVSGGKGSGGKGKGGNQPGPGEPPKKPLRTSLSKSWKWDRGWR